jgi:hypothetical protein
VLFPAPSPETSSQAAIYHFGGMPRMPLMIPASKSVPPNPFANPPQNDVINCHLVNSRLPCGSRATPSPFLSTDRETDAEGPIMTPEPQARQKIDAQLLAPGWIVQEYAKMDLSVVRGNAQREVPLKTIPTFCGMKVSSGDYVKQLTFLLFLKMADEQAKPPFNKPSPIAKVFGSLSIRGRVGAGLVPTRHPIIPARQKSSSDGVLSSRREIQ